MKSTDQSKIKTNEILDSMFHPKSVAVVGAQPCAIARGHGHARKRVGSRSEIYDADDEQHVNRQNKGRFDHGLAAVPAHAGPARIAEQEFTE